MVKKKKKFKNLKLVISLIFMSLVLVVSVGGLTIIKGVNANENDSTLATNTDVIKDHELVDFDYISSGNGSNKKEQIKIESNEQAIYLINNFFSTKAYEVTSSGKMGVSGKVDGVSDYAKICDLDYHDYFTREITGRAYWEEGFKMGRFYNGFLETVYDSVMSMMDYTISNMNRFYFIDNETFFKQYLKGVNFTNGFQLSQNVLNSAGAYKSSNADYLKSHGYNERYFRWNINEKTVKNAELIKTVYGYKFDFELDAETGARDVYKRLVSWIPANITRSVAPGVFSYSFTFDRFGNVVSFSRNETIKMSLTGKGIGLSLTGSGDLNFNFKYSVRTKGDNFKIAVDTPFTNAILGAGYSL